MSPEDPYSTFRTAFEVQKSEIERLQNRVSELEKVNTEVLSYVKRRGSLPVLNYIDTSAEGCSGRSIDVDSEFNFESAAATSKESDMKFSLFGENAGDLSVTGDVSSTGSTLLSDLVAQHTLELDKALETLGLESSKRNQLLDQVRINVNSLLHNQLNSEFGSSARPAGLDQIPVPPLLCREKPEKLIPPASSGGDCTTQAGWPISSLDALAFDKPNASSVHSSSRLDVQRIQAHHCSMQSAIQEVQEKRRMELMRLNNRMHLPPASETEAVIHTAAAHPVPSATSITTASPSVRNVSASGLVQTNNDLEPCSLNGLPFHAISTPMLDNSKASVPFASPRLRSPIQQYRTCPCGNRQNCPLTPTKQRRFGNDPRVARGFTLLAAAFRGRLVRQLLATHKVCDLIRTVKDTAKLALSIHTERLSSFYQSTCNGSLLSNGHSAGQKSEGISSEELVLESRLMVQLRGALGQLHEVFFSWPLSNKLELLAISRSLTQRQKRLSNRFSNIREDSYSAEPMIDGWAPCEPMDASRRYQSGASHCSSRDIYDFPARRHMEKPGSYGSYSLTKSIDSVRQSWPQNPSLEKRKNASFPLSGLTALAYDNAEQQQIQPHESCEDLVSSVSNLPHTQMHKKSNTTAKSRTRIQSSLPTRRPRSSRNRTSNAQSSDRVSSPPDKLLSYTPVRLHTPPTPNTLESMTSIPAKLIDKSIPPSPTAMLRPPVGRASCFNLRQMCQNLRIERQRSSQTDLSISSSQHRPTQLHRRGALLVHRASSSTQLGSTVTLPDPVPIRTLKTEESKSSSLLRSRLIAKSQAHLARHHGGQKNKRCLSSLSLTDTQTYKTPWRIHRSTSALAEYPARVPYWKEVLWQWRHQRRDRAEIADELPMSINHNTTTRSDPTVQI